MNSQNRIITPREAGLKISTLTYKTKKKKNRKVFLNFLISVDNQLSKPVLYRNLTDHSDTYVAIKFYLPYSDNVQLILMDSDRTEEICFIDKKFEAGNHTIVTDLRNDELKTFKYYYKILTSEYSEVRKMKYRKVRKLSD